MIRQKLEELGFTDILLVEFGDQGEWAIGRVEHECFFDLTGSLLWDEKHGKYLFSGNTQTRHYGHSTWETWADTPEYAIAGLLEFLKDAYDEYRDEWVRQEWS